MSDNKMPVLLRLLAAARTVRQAHKDMNGAEVVVQSCAADIPNGTDAMPRDKLEAFLDARSKWDTALADMARAQCELIDAADAWDKLTGGDA